MLDTGGGGFGSIPGLQGQGSGITGGGDKKRPKLQFSVPCLGVDEEKGPPCFMYIFYELPLPDIPYKFPDNAGFFIANGWCNGQGSFAQRMKIFGPAKKSPGLGQPLGEGLGGDGEKPLVDTNAQPFTLKERETPFMAINFIQGFEFKEAGTYRIQVLLDDTVELEYPMVVRKQTPDAPKPT